MGEKEQGLFQKYLDLLLEWNEKFNLTAITKPEEVWTKHFLDSLTVLEALPKSAKKIIDIGSGAGFPGLPLAIVRPDLDITLLEATGKKVKFFGAVIKGLGLKNVRALHGRAEDKIGASQYDVVLARAVALLPVLWNYAYPLLKKGGALVAMKKQGGSKEIDKKFILKIVPVNISPLSPRELVIIKKN